MAYSAYIARLTESDEELSVYHRDLYDQVVTQSYLNASDIYDVLKLNQITGLYETFKFRVMSIYDITQASTLKDDHKKIVFPYVGFPSQLGDLYQFGGYYWMNVDTGRTKSTTDSCQVARCADFLRFFDDEGVYHSVPCIVRKGVMLDLENDYYQALPNNQLRILAPYDTVTKLIKWADSESADNKFTRFLLEGVPYRTVALDRSSYVRLGIGYLDIRLQLDVEHVGSDDFVNNIADAFAPQNNIAISILNGNTTIGVTQNLQLFVDVTKNGIIVDNPSLTFVSATPTVATIDALGLVTAFLAGTSTLSATFGAKTTSILLTSTPVVQHNYTIDFESNIDNLISITVGQTNILTALFRDNGVAYTDSSTWSLTDDTGIAPTSLASIVVSTGTSCTIKSTTDISKVGQYFRLYCIGTNATNYIRFRVKSLF
jgi:hypothetical protein